MRLMKNKYILSLLFLGILFVVFSPYIRTSEVSADWRIYADLGTLVDKSNIVFVGEITGEGNESYSDKLDAIITDYPVKVHEVIKDDSNEIKNESSVAQFGGTANGKTEIIEKGAPIPEKGKKYLFCVLKTEDGHNMIFYQGQMLINQNDEVTLKDKKLKLNDLVKEIKDYIKDKKTKTEKLF